MDQQRTLQIRVFISNTRSNRELARSLRYDLEAKGFLVQSDEDIPPGSFVFDKIREAVESSHAVILVESFGEEEESYTIATEVGFARLYKRPAMIIRMHNAGEFDLDFLYDPLSSFFHNDIVGYDEVVAAIIVALNALKVDIERVRESTLRIRITEPQLTAQNLTGTISALTELSTKYWLITKGRFADLIEYTQTHSPIFAEEANTIITRVSYNSPLSMDLKVDLSATGLAEALVTTVNGIIQRKERLEQVKLANQAKAQEIREAEQKTKQENQKAVLEREEQRLKLEERRLEILEKQLEVQKKVIEYALEIASNVVNVLHPDADPATRAMEIQALLPSLLLLQNSKGLELELP